MRLTQAARSSRTAAQKFQWVQFHKSCLEARAADPGLWSACTDKLVESKAAEQPAGELIDISGRRSPAGGVICLVLSRAADANSSAHAHAFPFCSAAAGLPSSHTAVWQDLLSTVRVHSVSARSCADHLTCLALQVMPGQHLLQIAQGRLRHAQPPCRLTPWWASAGSTHPAASARIPSTPAQRAVRRLIKTSQLPYQSPW